MKEHAKPHPAPARSQSDPVPSKEEALERELDDALEATFPASDPIAVDSRQSRDARRTDAAADKPARNAGGSVKKDEK